MVHTLTIEQFSSLLYREMVSTLKELKDELEAYGLVRTGKMTRKVHFIALYTDYLRRRDNHSPDRTTRDELLKKLTQVQNCRDDDIRCMMVALGMSPKQFDTLLLAQCDRICKSKVEQALALTVDPSTGMAVGLQTQHGAIPLERPVPPPPSKPVVVGSESLLAQIRNAKGRVPINRVQTVPDKKFVSVQPTKNGKTFVGLNTTALMEQRKRLQKVPPVTSRPTKSKHTYVKPADLKKLRESVAFEDDEDDDWSDDEFF